MSRRVVGKGVMGLVIVVILAAWIGLVPSVAAGPRGGLAYDPATNTYTVPATGTDDTANLQAAFDGCAEQTPGCIVQLGAGTYHTDMVVVNDFQGEFRGMGEQATTIEALPNYPSPTAVPFWTELPNSDNPWPVMFVFFDVDLTMTGITFSVPWAEPSQGWIVPTPFGDLTLTALNAAIIISGEHADARMDHVAVLGAAGNWFGSNMVNGVYCEGILLKPGWTNPFVDFIMVSGSFSMTNSRFYRIDFELAFQNLVDATVTVRHSTFDTSESPMSFLDVSNSALEFNGNTATNVFGWVGIWGMQGYAITDLLPSEALIANNDLHVAEGGTGIQLTDFAATPTLQAVVSQNEIVLGMDSVAGISIQGQTTAVVAQNEVRGIAGVGVYFNGGTGTVSRNEIRGGNVGILLEGATGVAVERNEVRSSATWGIAVTAESSGVMIMRNTVRGSGQYDLYWDGAGTGNVWSKNEYRTSSPTVP